MTNVCILIVGGKHDSIIGLFSLDRNFMRCGHSNEKSFT